MKPDMDDRYTKTERETTRGIEAHNSLHDVSIYSQDSKVEDAIESDENSSTMERKWTSVWYNEERADALYPRERADALYPRESIQNTPSKTRISTIETNNSAEVITQNLIARVKRRSFMVGDMQHKAFRMPMPAAVSSGDVEMPFVSPLVA